MRTDESTSNGLLHNPCSETRGRTDKYQSDHRSRQLTTKDEAGERVVSFLEWYNQQHDDTGIMFRTPVKRQTGTAAEVTQDKPLSTRRSASPQKTLEPIDALLEESSRRREQQAKVRARKVPLANRNRCSLKRNQGMTT